MSRIKKISIGNATLYQGNCTDILEHIPQVDIVLTDPPYSSGGLMRSDRIAKSGNKYTKKQYQDFSGDNRDQRSMTIWCSWWISQFAERMSNGGALLAFIDWRNLPLMVDAVQVGGLVYRGIIPWNKMNGRPNKGYFRV